jgi:DNA-binding response OmpR family regulator
MRRQPLVVVVEDDEEMNQLQQELLAVHGLDAVAAHTGAEALEVCRQYGADAVLLDLMLPTMDGLETCRRLRQEGPRRLPIIIVTALDSDDCRKQGLEAGADAYFAKPFDPDEVIGALRRLLDQTEANDGAGGRS